MWCNYSCIAVYDDSKHKLIIIHEHILCNASKEKYKYWFSGNVVITDGLAFCAYCAAYYIYNYSGDGTALCIIKVIIIIAKYLLKSIFLWCK